MNKLHRNFNRNSNIFIQENAFESVVCEMAAIMLSRPQCVNSLRPGGTCVRWWTWPSLVQVRTCCLFSDKPFSEPILAYSIAIKFSDVWSKIQQFNFKKMYFNMSSAVQRLFCSRPNVLTFVGIVTLSVQQCATTGWNHHFDTMRKQPKSKCTPVNIDEIRRDIFYHLVP